MTIDKSFFDAHPPLIVSADDDIPDRSDLRVIGRLPVKGTDINRVVDPRYPWRDFAANHTPPYRKKVQQLVAQRDAEVDHYLVTRRRFWEMVKRFHFGTDTQVSIIKHVGFVEHKTHTTEQTDSAVTRIAADLGIDISPGGAAVPGETPPVIPPVAMAAATGAAAGGSGGSGKSDDGGGNSGTLGLHFSYEMTRVLHITDTDDQTFTDETTTQTTVTFAADTTYVYWQMQEECTLERFLKTAPSEAELVDRTVAATTWDYTDRFPRGTPRGGGGDIH